MATQTVVEPGKASSEDLGAPLYVGWQITNECNLACLHCIEESGPGKAFKDELSREEALAVVDQLIKSEVPYVSLSGGEPLLRPDFFELAGRLTAAGVGLKVETNGHHLTPGNCARLAEIGIKAAQVSLDGAYPASYEKMRVTGRFKSVLEGIRNLHRAGVPIEINFVPAKFNIGEIADVVDISFREGAYSFYTGKLMFAGNAVRAWKLIAPSLQQYAPFFKTLCAKAKEYDGRMRVYYHEMGLLEELRYRLKNPAALFIILPNGKVKLINALPFICGNLRSQSLSEVWSNFKRAWKDPKVSEFVGNMANDPALISSLHRWVEL